MLFMTDSGIWRRIADFARSFGVSEEDISKAKRDLYELRNRFAETHGTLGSKYASEELDNSLSMQNFYPWRFSRFFLFYQLYLSGFRHTSLRELRFYIESSARAYYIDTEFCEKTYEDKVKLLNIFKPRKTEEDLKLLQTLLCEKQYEKVISKRLIFGKLLEDLANKKYSELAEFYDELCNYVHLSEMAQTDALRDFGLNLALRHPEYESDREMLEKTFQYSRYLLLRTLERKKPLTSIDRCES